MRRGDPEFTRAVDLTIAHLREQARTSTDDGGALVTYSELSRYLAIEGLDVPPFGGPMPQILEEASVREDLAGRGLISALVVQQGANGTRGVPAAGFYRLARRRPFRRTGDDLGIWISEVRRIRQENRAERASGGRKVSAATLGAWMLTSNPDVWDLQAFLDAGRSHIDRWSVVPTYRTELMAANQRVLFWVTGRDHAHLEPGLWGAGTVTGPTFDEPPSDDPGLWLDDNRRQRRRLIVPVDIDLLARPVPRAALRADPRLGDLEVLRQPQMPNPLVVTPDELAALDEHLGQAPRQVVLGPYGAGFGSPEANAAVEQAAIAVVTRHYGCRRWTVTDDSHRNLGWDLTCRSAHGQVEHVEVKGVSGTRPTVLLTRNEAQAAQDPAWRLAVVTRAGSPDPQLRIIDGATALCVTAPFMYQADLRGLDAPAILLTDRPPDDD